MTHLYNLLRYLRRLPVRRRLILRDVALGIAGAALLSIVAQLLYPSNRLLPSVEVQGLEFGGRSIDGVQKGLKEQFGPAKVIVQAGAKKIEAPLAQAGIEIDRTATARAAASYPVYQRLIPFSSLIIMIHRDTPARARFDDERLKYFADQIAKDAYVPAVNAGVQVTLGQALLVPAKPSQEFPPHKTMTALRQATFTPQTNVHIKAVNKPAARTDNDVRGVLGEAQQAVDSPLTITLDAETVDVDKTTIGGWLDFTPDTSGNLQLTLKTDAVQKYLEQIQTKIYKAPGTTKIKLIDGKEVSRTLGAPGRGIDISVSVELLNQAIRRQGERKIALPVVDLAPKIVYELTVSNTDAGLAALLSDIVKAKGNYGIAVMELNGRSGNANGNKQYTSASTFKLFVAYAVFKQIDSGAMHWTDTINGKTVEDCFDDMIVVSDNPCAKAFGDQIGWSKIDDMMDAIGLASTQVESGNHLTTPKDLALFLYKLENGTLVSSAHRSRLLDAMKRQIYRSGIPAGTGVTVADKVGFLGGLLHDAAIVYGPKGPYVLVIMSDGSSWSQVADAAKQVHTFLKQ